MIFTSSVFPVFLTIVLCAYVTTLHWRKANNVVLLISSYVFYSWVDWRLIFLLAASSGVDFVVSLLMDNSSSRRRKHLMWASVVFNLSLLGFFKYANFFISSFQQAFSTVGLNVDTWTLSIILPVGISFYTFQSMSYTIDVYRKRIEPCRSVIDYLCYVSFFPQLVAGPIERAGNLLTQFQKGRVLTPDKIVEGLYLILIGFFKKTVLADNLAAPVDRFYSDPTSYSSFEAMAATWLFAFQIYFDFSAYTDIARGLAKLMGFELMINFRQPYLSRSIAEFWTRWHISLSSFFRDYVFFPLGGSLKGTLNRYRNVIMVFFLSGLWHGASWTFVFWGLYHAVGYVTEHAFARMFAVSDTTATSLYYKSLRWAMTLLFVTVGWSLFRVESFTDLLSIYGGFADVSNWLSSDMPIISDYIPLYLATFGILAVEAWAVRNGKPVTFSSLPKAVRPFAVIAACLSVFWIGNANLVSFIYFQF